MIFDRDQLWLRRRFPFMSTHARGAGGNVVDEKFGDLRPGDEITIRTYGQLSCQAKVSGMRNGVITGFLWNSVAQRWNRNPIVIKPGRVVKYPERE
jgi:hypothetical protein